MKTATKIAKTAEKLQKAEEALAQARNAHREAFRTALVALFNEYRYYLDANGSEGARLEINAFGISQQAYRIDELPE